MKLYMKTFKETAIEMIEQSFNAWSKTVNLDPATVQMQTEYSPALQKFFTVVIYTEREVQDDDVEEGSIEPPA